jgi:hypothetical protein
MADGVTVSAIGYFMPIFAFLLVFIIIYAVLSKSKVLGDNNAVMLFISFVLASFFVVEASLVEFVVFNSAWFGVFAVIIFFLMALIGFLPGDEPFKFLKAGNWASWVVIGLAIVFFIISSAYIFNWAVNWGTLRSWFNTEWFGMILLLIIAGIASFVITRKVK